MLLAFFASSAFMASMYFLLSSSSWIHKVEKYIFNWKKKAALKHTDSYKNTQRHNKGKITHLGSVFFGFLHLLLDKLNQGFQLLFSSVNHHLRHRPHRDLTVMSLVSSKEQIIPFFKSVFVMISWALIKTINCHVPKDIIASYPFSIQSRKQAEWWVRALHWQVDIIGWSIDTSDDHVLALLKGLSKFLPQRKHSAGLFIVGQILNTHTVTLWSLHCLHF